MDNEEIYIASCCGWAFTSYNKEWHIVHKHSYFSWMIYCEFISSCIRITVTLTDEYLLLQSTCGPKKCLSWRVLVELCPGTNGILGN